MQIRPVKTKVDHRAALKEIERLMDAKPGTPAGDRLEVLTTLVERYESQHEPIEPPKLVDALLYYMESRGLAQRDLEPYLGSRVAEVLTRRRPLTIDMIRKLHRGLGLRFEAPPRNFGRFRLPVIRNKHRKNGS
jgi:HTH-type transcriptional regulator/antitoxin HigA